MSLPKEDILNYRKKELLDTITMTMAGRIAEEITAGDISTGAKRRHPAGDEHGARDGLPIRHER